MSPYSFRSRTRKTTRRYRKRNNFVLSKKSIYGSRSARAQSNQIAALNRKINYIAKRDRPEIKIVSNGSSTYKFTNGLGSSIWAQVDMPVPSPSSPADNGMVGNQCHMKNLYFNFYTEYYNSSTTGYHNNESSGGILRIVALQYKDTLYNGSTFNPNDFLHEFGNTGDTYTAAAYSPFKVGVTNTFRILLDRKYSINLNTQLVRNIRIPLGKYKTLRYNVNGANVGWENKIIVFIIGCGLHFDKDFDESMVTTCSMKLAYTDD